MVHQIREGHGIDALGLNIFLNFLVLDTMQLILNTQYSIRFTLFFVLDLCTRIKKMFNFVHLQNKNITTHTLNHISTNEKINRRILLINVALKS